MKFIAYCHSSVKFLTVETFSTSRLLDRCSFVDGLNVFPMKWTSQYRINNEAQVFFLWNGWTCYTKSLFFVSVSVILKSPFGPQFYFLTRPFRSIYHIIINRGETMNKTWTESVRKCNIMKWVEYLNAGKTVRLQTSDFALQALLSNCLHRQSKSSPRVVQERFRRELYVDWWYRLSPRRS